MAGRDEEMSRNQFLEKLKLAETIVGWDFPGKK